MKDTKKFVPYVVIALLATAVAFAVSYFVSHSDIMVSIVADEKWAWAKHYRGGKFSESPIKGMGEVGVNINLRPNLRTTHMPFGIGPTGFVIIAVAVPVLAIAFLVGLFGRANEESEKEFHEHLQHLPDGSRAAYILAYNGRKKSAVVALALALVLGGLGSHKFYLGKPIAGILYLFLCWTSIPSIIAFVGSFTVVGNVPATNRSAAHELIAIAQGIPTSHSPAQQKTYAAPSRYLGLTGGFFV